MNKNIDEPVISDLRYSVTITCLLGLVLLAITLTIDFAAQSGYIYLPSWVSIGDVDDARVLLSTILEAVSTVLGLVFSVVLLVLSMAATQFGPRLLRRFILDQNGVVTIGLFCTTFLFSLITLVVVRGAPNEYIPHVTTLTTVAFVIVSFGSLIWYSQSVRRAIQTGNLVAKIDYNLHRAFSDYVQHRKVDSQAALGSQENTEKLRDLCNTEGYDIITQYSGYLQGYSRQALLEAASDANAVILLKVRPGHFILTSTIIAKVFPASQGPKLNKILMHLFNIGPHRTLAQDPEFAIAQIVEIACRALSPAINDPFTGVACIDWLSDALISLANMPAVDGLWRDHKGKIRVIEIVLKFPRLAAASFDMIRQYGASSPAVLIRMLHNFTRMAPYLKEEEQRAAIMRQANAILEYSKELPFASVDKEDLERIYAEVNAQLK